jgi:outer membrane usher protein
MITQHFNRLNGCVPYRQVFLCLAIVGALTGKAHAATAPVADPAVDPRITASADASASEIVFDRSMLFGAEGNVTTDVSRFERGNVVLPGTYNMDVYLNDVVVTRTDVRFAAPSANENAVPCVSRKLLEQLNLRPSNLSPELQAQLNDPKACVNISTLVPSSSMSFDMVNLRLDTSVPQAYLQQMPRGYVSPEYWDNGVPAALLNYNFNAYRTNSGGQSQKTYYLGLNDGFNIGAWHFRNDAAVSWLSATAATPAQHKWQNIATYVQRDLPAWRARLTLGDSYTDGQVYDSFGIRGVQLGTDDRMLPQSLQGYAPVVRGIAETNALVTVRQNGALIYQATVAPGPFEIKDLYATGYGGNLDVTVTEADGRARTFAVPYASLVQLLRPGVTRFDFAIGQLRNQTLSSKPPVLEGTVQHGFSNLLTGYAGVQGSQGYASALIGTALNTSLGAFALDITQAIAHIPGFSTQSGQSMRLSYSKLITETNTSLSVAAYRYSTSGFLSLTDAAIARDYVRRGISPFDYIAPTLANLSANGVPPSLLTPAQQRALYGFTTSSIVGATGLSRQRSNFTLSMNQRLGDGWGSLYINASIADYWNRSGSNTQYQVGYNNSFHGVSYGVSATRTLDPYGRHDTQYFVNASVPLGTGAHSPTFNTSMTRDASVGTQEQATVSGSLGVDNNLSYAVTGTHGNAYVGNSGSFNLGYRSPYAVFNTSYGTGNGYSQVSLSVNGSIVAHPGGVTFGQPISDTVGIVYAPGAQGALIGNSSGTRVDHFGYAVVPYLIPYSLNTVTIDPKGLPMDVQLDETSSQVAPHAGAVVMVKFKTESGRMLVVRALTTDGGTLPFGTEVFDQKGTSLGVVGQGGKILVRGAGNSGVLTARWQDEQGADHACSFPFALPPGKATKERQKAFDEIQATCKPVAVTNTSTEKSSS